MATSSTASCTEARQNSPVSDLPVRDVGQHGTLAPLLNDGCNPKKSNSSKGRGLLAEMKRINALDLQPTLPKASDAPNKAVTAKGTSLKELKEWHKMVQEQEASKARLNSPLSRLPVRDVGQYDMSAPLLNDGCNLEKGNSSKGRGLLAEMKRINALDLQPTLPKASDAPNKAVTATGTSLKELKEWHKMVQEQEASKARLNSPLSHLPVRDVGQHDTLAPLLNDGCNLNKGNSSKGRGLLAEMKRINALDLQPTLPKASDAPNEVVTAKGTSLKELKEWHKMVQEQEASKAAAASSAAAA